MSNWTKITDKLYKNEAPDGAIVTYAFQCPACGHPHTIPTPRWGYNGQPDKPSFSPSVRHFYYDPQDKGKPLSQQKQITTCHYTITDGQIQFHDDNPHQLKGQKVEMIPVEEKWL